MKRCCPTRRYGISMLLCSFFTLFMTSVPVRAKLACNNAGKSPPQIRNQGVVGIVSGQPGGTYIQMAADLAAVHSDFAAHCLRVVPIVGHGSPQNIDDLLYLQGVGLAIVQQDVLNEFRRKNRAEEARRIHYISRLHREEVHVLARESIASLADLQGKRVSIGTPQSGHHLTATEVLEKSGLWGPQGPSVKTIDTMDANQSLEKLKAGEIDAMFFVGGKPIQLFKGLLPSDKLHFLDLTEAALRDIYVDAVLTSSNYQLISDAKPVRTVAVRAVLAAYGGFDPKSERYQQMKRFVEQFFEQFRSLREAGRHQKWHEVEIYDEVPQWQRLRVAQEWLDTHPKSQRPDGNKPDCRPPFGSWEGYRSFLVQREPEKVETFRKMSDDDLKSYYSYDRETQARRTPDSC